MRARTALAPVLLLCIGLGGPAFADGQDDGRQQDRQKDAAESQHRDHDRAKARHHRKHHRARVHKRHDQRQATDLKNDLASLQKLDIDYDELRRQAGQVAERLGVDLKEVSLDSLRSTDSKSMRELRELLSSYLSAEQDNAHPRLDAAKSRIRDRAAHDHDRARQPVIDEHTTKRLRTALQKLKDHGRHKGVRARHLKHGASKVNRAAHRARHLRRAQRRTDGPADRATDRAPARRANDGRSAGAPGRPGRKNAAGQQDSRE